MSLFAFKGKGIRWLGTIGGSVLGLLLAGPVGALFGAALGQGVDRGLLKRRFRAGLTPSRQPPAKEDCLIEATFAVMGHLAKADGRVSEAEIAFAESLMDRMELKGDGRRAAIQWFNRGKAPGFDLAAVLDDLYATHADAGAILDLFLKEQLSTAYVDGPPASDQRWILDEIRRRLKVSSATYRRLEMLAVLQRRTANSPPGGAGGRPGRSGSRAKREYDAAAKAGTPGALENAYAELGLQAAASNDEIKRAYRRLMSQHHPDKLASLGLPAEALRMASEKTQQIRRAYETLARERSL